MSGELFALILGHPLFGLVLTIGIYAAADLVYKASGQRALLHPVLTSVATISAIVGASGMGYSKYFSQAASLHWALSLFVVLLAIPLLRQMPRIRAAGLPLAVALGIGSVTAIGTALAPAAGFHLDPALSASLAPKSATAAVAVGISDHLGGLPGLTAVVVISTGIVGAAFGPSLLRVTGVRDERAVGLALGLASHGIGTARAFQISERTGAFATVGMVLNAILTVLLAPVALRMLIG